MIWMFRSKFVFLVIVTIFRRSLIQPICLLFPQCVTDLDLQRYVADGVTGFSCATNDVSGFAERMDQYAADDVLCRKIGAINMKAVLKYDISIITETVCRLINFDD